MVGGEERNGRWRGESIYLRKYNMENNNNNKKKTCSTSQENDGRVLVNFMHSNSSKCEYSLLILTESHKTNCLSAYLNSKIVLAESEYLGVFVFTSHSVLEWTEAIQLKRIINMSWTFFFIFQSLLYILFYRANKSYICLQPLLNIHVLLKRQV